MANKFSEADRKSGLDSVLRGASLNRCEHSAGPDGGFGVLAMIASEGCGAENCFYSGEEGVQFWRKVNDHYWIGYHAGSPPTPKDLAREKQVPGEIVELKGNEWMIPVCGPHVHKLPFAFKLNEHGKWTPEVEKEYKHLQQMCHQAMLDMKEAKDATNDRAIEIFERHMEFCANMVAVNYRVSRWEVDALEILTSETFMKIISVAIGNVTYTKEQEKAKAATDLNG